MINKFKKIALRNKRVRKTATIVKTVYALPGTLETQTSKTDTTVIDVALLQKQNSAFREQLKEMSMQLKSLDISHDNLRQQIGLLASTTAASATQENTSSTSPGSFADDHLLDIFYTNFEDKFRGSEDMISKRLEEYLPYFSNTNLNFKKSPVLDIGSGRGELLTLLKANKISAMGLDINVDMVERSLKKGLTAEQGDAITYLQNTDSQKFSAITGFHIVEHIPFNLLLRMFTSAHRALVPGGFAIFETPNPENVIVGSCNFYMDPSHLHPLPPDLLAFALETAGFRDIEIKRIHPVKEVRESSDTLNKIAGSFYGPRDYAVIGYR